MKETWPCLRNAFRSARTVVGSTKVWQLHNTPTPGDPANIFQSLYLVASAPAGTRRPLPTFNAPLFLHCSPDKPYPLSTMWVLSLFYIFTTCLINDTAPEVAWRFSSTLPLLLFLQSSGPQSMLEAAPTPLAVTHKRLFKSIWPPKFTLGLL